MEERGLCPGEVCDRATDRGLTMGLRTPSGVEKLLRALQTKAKAFGTSWHHVYRSVEMAAEWGAGESLPWRYSLDWY